MECPGGPFVAAAHGQAGPLREGTISMTVFFYTSLYGINCGILGTRFPTLWGPHFTMTPVNHVRIHLVVAAFIQGKRLFLFQLAFSFVASIVGQLLFKGGNFSNK